MTVINPEARLRKLAKASGYDLRKATGPTSPRNMGGFRLSEIASGQIIAGERYQLSIRDAAIELQKLHVLGFGG
ncbi:hypothetical protein [Breoghania sp.]|uniref:hypothetical protein n=1 Tax=Breoghania sp. TaxID=2065378 RepID=UPI002AA77A2E|nr:hypothetical protein [Breoghania sp.]